MPRKKNRRKAIQKARREAEPKAKRIANIGHFSSSKTGLALAILASGIFRHDEPRPLNRLRTILKEP